MITAEFQRNKCIRTEEGIHGGDLLGAALASGKRREELLDFSANINPLGMSEGIKKAVLDGLEGSLHYPDPYCRELREALAEQEGCKAEQILCGNGGADLIYRLVYALKPRKALVTAPTFAEYEEALNQTGAEIRYWELGETFQIQEDILEAVTADLNLMFLCNPNNPTGLLTKKELLLRILQKAKAYGVTVLVDECFLDFVQEQEHYTLVGDLMEYENLVILKSFTKLYAIPGFRLGYVLSAREELLERMRKAGQPWSVSTLAQTAGLAALQEEGFRERTLEEVDRERAFLCEELKKLNFHVIPGQANYLCFRAEGERSLQEKMLKQGILIRSCANYRGLTVEYYRIAVRNREENQRLLEALKNILTEKKQEVRNHEA